MNRSGPNLHSFLFGLFLPVLIAGCASSPVDEIAAVQPDQVDKLYVVDCLLPAQVRKLGQHLTYLAARRPVRTTAIDCEIRGGEYVAYDRSNYATALKVWLPKAKEGDPKAQTYVGEIFEKGRGLPPDYQAAAQWYRRAAEQGYAPAMINLGFLYEKGLGVPREPVTALNWYRKASGLDKTDIAFAASVAVYNRKMEALREEASRYRQEAAGLRERLTALQRQQRKTSAYLQKYRAQVDASRREIQRLKKLLKSRPSGGDTGQGEALRKKLQRQLAKLQEKQQMVSLLEQELKAQNRKLASLEQGSAQALQEKENRIQDLETELARRDQALLALRRQLSDSRERLKSLRRQVAGDNQALQSQMDRLHALEKSLAEKERAGTATREELARLKEALRQKQTAIENQRARLAQNEAALKALVEKNRTLAQTLAEREKQVETLRANLAGSEERIQVQEGRLKSLESELVRRDQALKQLNERLAAANQALQSQQQALKTLEQELARKQASGTAGQAEVEKLTTRLNAKEAEIQRQLETIRKLETDLARLRQQRPVKGEEPELVARTQAPGEGDLWIEIIDPPLRPQRGELMVVTRGLVEARTIVGKIHAAAPLLAFIVNDQDFIPDADGNFKIRVTLKGQKTPVRLAAIDKQSRRTELEFMILRKQEEGGSITVGPGEPQSTSDLSRVLPRKIFGRYYALIIGNNAYRYLPTLDTPINDARGLAKVLRERYGFETKVLTDATRYDILKALNEYRKKLTEKDNFLIYYAGHGTMEEVTRRGFWLPVDAELENTANWISNQDITDLLRIMSAGHVMVIADSCYSGALTRSSVARLETGMTPEKKAEWIKLMLKARSRMALTSGGLNPVLDGGGEGHSVFANALIKALRKNGGILESFRLYTEVSALVAHAAREQDFHQVPEFAPIRHGGHEAGEFFFVPKTAANDMQAKL